MPEPALATGEARRGYIDVVKELLANGADPNAKTNDGKTAIMVASHKGHFDIVKELQTTESALKQTDQAPRIGTQETLGVWENNFLNGTITIYKNEKGLFFKEVFYNSDNSYNSELTERLVVKNILNTNRLIISGNSYGDYFVIEEDGNLGMYDDEGLIDTAINKSKKQNYKSKPKKNTYSRSSSCYGLGYKYGRCATMVLKGRKCDPDDDIIIPVRCRGKQETQKGITDGTKSVW